MIGVGLIGFGYWGPNVARNVVAEGGRLLAVSDLNPARLTAARARHGSIQTTPDWRAVVDNPDVAAVAVATPATTHYAMVEACLAAGKHVLVEKPMTVTSSEAHRLVASAAQRRLILMVDHTFLYAGGIAAIARTIADGSLGEVRAYESIRTGPPAFPRDVDVVWDLAVHDAAILDHLFGVPETLAVAGSARPPSPLVDDARLTLTFRSGLIATVHVGWRSQEKTRLIRITGTRRTITYDETATTRKVELRSASAHGNETVTALDISDREPLAEVVREFLDCVASGRKPRSDGVAGQRAIEILELASASLKDDGRTLAVAAKVVS